MGSNVVIAILAFAFGGIFFYIGWRDRQKNLTAMTWPTVMGKIVGSELDSYIKTDEDGDKTTMYRPLVTYEFEVEGDVYTCTQVRAQGFTATNFQSVQLEKLKEFPVGGEVEVHYNPFTPEDALLEIDPSKINIPMIIGIVCGLIVLYNVIRLIMAI
ncbi:MAG: DUF3592 domain-containing protein [Anaerolineales bacterium]|jgi:hypothetical protein